MSDECVRIEITSGFVKDSRLISRDGFRRLDDEIGKHLFLVDAVFADGSHLVVWDGASHAGALEAANHSAGDLPIVDLTNGEAAA